MSFILDALKKSESDRQRNDRPESAFIPAVTPRKSPARWAWIVGALLLVNIFVMLFVLLRPGVPVAPIPQAGQVASDPPPVVIAKPVVDVGQRSPGETTVPLQKNTTSAVEIAPPEPRSDARPVEQPAEFPRTNLSVPSTRSIAYKTFDEVRVEGTVQLTDLHLDIHVYSATQADRFVFINMNKYRENMTLGEGPRVTEIVPEGVILEFRGTQFLLPRE